MSEDLGLDDSSGGCALADEGERALLELAAQAFDIAGTEGIRFLAEVSSTMLDDPNEWEGEEAG